MKKIVVISFMLLSSILSYSKQTTLEERQAIDINGTMYYKATLTPFSGKLTHHKDRKYYTNGKPDGKWLCFYTNGNLKSIENWKKGKLVGKYILYAKNGRKVFETTYINGKDNGEYYMYYPDGQLQVKGQFKIGVPTGTWSFYNQNGKLTGKTVYDK